MNPGAIVFDLDGTLIDSAPDLQAIANAVLAPHGAKGISLEETRDFIGNGVGVFVTRIMAARGLGQDADLHAHLSADFTARYVGAVEHSRLYPGVLTALQQLVDQGHRLGLCTNKPMAPTRTVLQHFGLAEYLGAVVARDTLKQCKPDPAPLHHAFDLLGDASLSRLYVGDSEVDVATAENANTDMALYTPGYRHTPVEVLKHAYVFDDFAELPGIVSRHFAPY